MIMEITALRARLAHLQRENHNFREMIRKEVQEDYEALVQNLFMVCLQLKVGTTDGGEQNEFAKMVHYKLILLICCLLGQTTLLHTFLIHSQF